MRQCIVQGFFPGQVLPYLGTQQIHILTDFVGMGVFKSSRVLAQFPRHAGHDDFAHPVFTGRSEALRDKVPDAGERRFGQRGKPPFRAGLRASAGAEHHCRPVGDMVRFHANPHGSAYEMLQKGVQTSTEQQNNPPAKGKEMAVDDGILGGIKNI